jgi:hypothetical protein
MQKPVLVTLFAAIALLFMGCMSEVQYDPRIEIPSKPGLLKDKKVVVAGFVKSVQDISATSSSGITKILESAHVQDISLIVTNYLVNKGIQADARSEFKVSQLRDDEVLLRGAAISIPMDAKRLAGPRFGNAMLLICTVGIVGIVLPTPIAYITGRTFYYRMEIVDSQGRILMQTGDQRSDVYTTKHHMLGGQLDDDEYTRLAENAFFEQIVQKLK